MKNTILTVKKELRAGIRDRKSLIMMFVTPLFIPLFIFVLSAAFSAMLDNVEEVRVVGHDYYLSEVKEEIVSHLNIELKQFETDELQGAFEEGEILAYITFENDTFIIHGNPNTQESHIAMSEVMAALTMYNQVLAYEYLLLNGVDPENVFGIVQFDVEELEGNNDLISQLLFLGFAFAIIAITTSAIQAATDSTAGEKEKGTLETLLTFPVKSKELITGKYIACVIACLATAIISGVLLVASLFIAQNMFEIYEDMVLVDFSGLAITISAVLLVGYSLFISGVSIALGSMTKTFKEAQSTLMPLSYIPMIPMFMNMFGIEMTELISIIPIINHTLLLNEIFLGNINMLHIGLMFVSTLVYVVVVIKYIVHQYKSEKILFGT